MIVYLAGARAFAVDARVARFCPCGRCTRFREGGKRRVKRGERSSPGNAGGGGGDVTVGVGGGGGGRRGGGGGAEQGGGGSGEDDGAVASCDKEDE